MAITLPTEILYMGMREIPEPRVERDSDVLLRVATVGVLSWGPVPATTESAFSVWLCAFAMALLTGLRCRVGG